MDTEARHAHKTRHSRQDGYKGHVAVEPETGLFTGVELAKAAGDDNHEAVIGLRLLARGTRSDVLGDSAYGTGEMRAALGAPRPSPFGSDQATAAAGDGAGRVQHR